MQSPAEYKAAAPCPVPVTPRASFLPCEIPISPNKQSRTKLCHFSGLKMFYNWKKKKNERKKNQLGTVVSACRRQRWKVKRSKPDWATE